MVTLRTFTDAGSELQSLKYVRGAMGSAAQHMLRSSTICAQQLQYLSCLEHLNKCEVTHNSQHQSQ